MDRSIDYVIAVAECRSISQAAEMLYISQPSLSRYLSNLENELGVNLFVRTLNGTELTEAGKIYLEYAKEIKLLRSTMDSKIKALKREKKNRIRVGMTLNAASLMAFNITQEVKKKYPGCDYEMLYQDPYVLVVPDRYDIEAYAERKDENVMPFVDLKDLPPMDYIFQDETTSVRKGINQIMKKQKLEIIPKMVVTSSTLAIQAAENGIGCCIVVVGHLTYISRGDRLRVYQVSGQEISSAGVVSLRSKTFTEEEKYCIAMVKRALLEGEKEIHRRLRLK